MKATTYFLSCLSLLAILFTASSCQKEVGPAGANGTNGTNGPLLTGDITGFVRPLDEFGNILLDKSGVTATLENTNPLVTATSDANGKFTLTGVKTGTYNITLSKAGYGTMKLISVSHAGGSTATTLYRTEISQISSSIISNFTATNGISTYTTIAGTVTPTPTATTPRDVFIVFSTNPNPTPENSTYIDYAQTTTSTSNT